MPKIHAAILTYNNRTMLADLLRDLYGQTLLPERIFVVDNASTDGTADIMTSSFPDVAYERLPENTGSAGGYYRLLEKATPGCDFVWTLDDDVRLKPDALEHLVAGFNSLAEQHRLGAVRSVGSWYSGSSTPMPLRSISWRGSLFSSAAIREIGYPRTDYFLYGDDLEYSFRLAKAGYECFWVPLSVCDERRSSNKLRINVSGHEFRIYATPFRHYYAVRNELHAALYHRRMLHAARVIAYAGKVAATLVLTRKCGSGATISALYAGLVHGMTGRLGRNPRYTPDSKIV